jgi:hypothetical protein
VEPVGGDELSDLTNVPLHLTCDLGQSNGIWRSVALRWASRRKGCASYADARCDRVPSSTALRAHDKELSHNQDEVGVEMPLTLNAQLEILPDGSSVWKEHGLIKPTVSPLNISDWL